MIFLALACLCGGAFASPATSPARAQLTAQAAVREFRGGAGRVRNLHLVEPGLWRSGRPGKDSYGQLSAMGVKTILNLEGRRVAGSERVRAARFPEITVVNVPMSGFHQPSFAQLDAALSVLDGAPRPILVHCRNGQDRTGVVVAAYRVVSEHRPIPDAVREARSFHCCHFVTFDLERLLSRYRAYRLGR